MPKNAAISGLVAALAFGLMLHGIVDDASGFVVGIAAVPFVLGLLQWLGAAVDAIISTIQDIGRSDNP